MEPSFDKHVLIPAKGQLTTLVGGGGEGRDVWTIIAGKWPLCLCKLQTNP